MNSSQTNLHQQPNGEVAQYQPVQSRNLDIVTFSGQSNAQNPSDSRMNIESIYGTMIKNIKDLGEFCKNSWSTVDTRIGNVEGRTVTLEEAVTALVSKDSDTTKIISDQFQFAENTVQALNWLKNSYEQSKTETQLHIQKLTDWLSNFKSEQEDISRLNQDVRALNVAKELSEDKLQLILNKSEGTTNEINQIKSQQAILLSKINDIESSSKKTILSTNAVEDRLQILEKKFKETLKTQDLVNKLEPLIREHGQDLLILGEDLNKLKKTIDTLEEKANKNGRKLTKNEKSLIDEIDTTVICLKEKFSAMETLVEHLNDVKFEDFARRFKKEIFENSDTQIARLSQSLKNLEEHSTLQSRTNDALQKNLQELKKKIDCEMLKVLDLKHIQFTEEKWNSTESKLTELSVNIEALLKKTKQHDNDIIGLSANVYDYSFHEMASSFDERVDNRLAGLKQQIKELSTQISNLNKVNLESNESNILLNKLQKLVENKLDAHSDMIDQKLTNLSKSSHLKLEPPLTTEDGKKILYKAGNHYLEPEDVKVSIDGSLHINKKCKLGLRCISRTCKYIHDDDLIKKPSSREKPTPQRNQVLKPRYYEGKLTPRSHTYQSDWKIKELCELKDQCPQSKCPFLHNRESCKGFKTCRDKYCQKRHHPSRFNLINDTKLPSQKQELIIPHQQPLYSFHQPNGPSEQYPLYISPTYQSFTLPNVSFPSAHNSWQGYPNMFFAYPHSQLHPGEWHRKF